MTLGEFAQRNILCLQTTQTTSIMWSMLSHLQPRIIPHQDGGSSQLAKLIKQPLEPKPKVGDVVYLPPRDYHSGGKAEISDVFIAISAGEPVWWVKCNSIGGSFNHRYLMENLVDFSKRYEGRIARSE